MDKTRLSKKDIYRRRFIKDVVLIGTGIVTLCIAAFFIWVATLDLPDLSNFTERKIENSTKIYDRTGKILLYNFHQNIKRTEVPLDQISDVLQKAEIAVEDAQFYSHPGIRVESIARAILSNLIPGGGTQGGSTITQQVVKNSLLTQDRTITRKVKEWILALKLERTLTKDQILGVYLNESPYGGSIYGVEEAAKTYFGKNAKDITLTEAAYLASIPQYPPYYSPYGSHLDALENRKNFVLKRMYEVGFITRQQYDTSVAERLTFKPQEDSQGKALHFVFYIHDYLLEKFGNDAVENQGLTVITTLDYALQKQLEDTLKAYVLKHEKDYNMSNAGLVAIDPKTGQILAMVGSRDYSDKAIDGNVNITTQGRQPGSSFKPIVYAQAFEKGYTPDTILFDVPTEFNVNCDALGNPPAGAPKTDCYMPNNYDDKFRGPVTLRSALAQSLNIPSVKLLYLTGVNSALTLAQQLGVKNLGDKNQYGLTLVLGGGEVSLLDLTGAYGVFANEGVRNPTTGILSIIDKDSNVLETFNKKEMSILPDQVARQISSVLNDNQARTPSYGATSPLYFPGRDVAVKTGTTQNYRDVWVVGYTPSVALGVWGGNNNNTPLIKKTSGFILAPLWRSAMDIALASSTIESFTPPVPTAADVKPILQGVWCVPTTFGTEVHTILHWLNKDDPNGEPPANPQSDPQYNNWELPVQKWLLANPSACVTTIAPGDALHTNTGVPTSD